MLHFNTLENTRFRTDKWFSTRYDHIESRSGVCDVCDHTLGIHPKFIYIPLSIHLYFNVWQIHYPYKVYAVYAVFKPHESFLVTPPHASSQAPRENAALPSDD